MTKTFIIAEVGINHNANLDIAYELIDAATKAGADAIKFQTAIPELVATNLAQKANYQKKTSVPEESQIELIRRIHFPLDVYQGLKLECERRGIIFFSSAFDLVSLTFLENLGQLFHKIPSGEITNLPYLREIAHYKKPIFLSTGMSTMKEIETAISVLEKGGMPRKKITVMHCNTEYPTPMIDVNLLAMRTIGEVFDIAVGYSDHTEGVEVSIAAVALGACTIEKHLTLDRNLPGPDHKASIEPQQFEIMVNSIRNIENALGNTTKQPSPSELQNIMICRRSIVAASPIKAGEEFTSKNIIAKRPGNGLSPMLWDDVIGKKASRNFDTDELIDI